MTEISAKVQEVLWLLISKPGQKVIIASKTEEDAEEFVKELKKELEEIGMGDLFKNVKSQRPRPNKKNTYKMKGRKINE